MKMFNKENYIYWSAAAVFGLTIAGVARHVVLISTEDAGTANIIFFVFLVVAFILSLIFHQLIEGLAGLIIKRLRKRPKYRPELPEGEFKNKVDAFCRYSDEILKGYVSDEDLKQLHIYIRQYAEGEMGNIPGKIKTVGIDNFDLYHYGWNIWNHFKATKLPAAASWLINVFTLLDGSKPIIHKKFKHNERYEYKIPIEYNIE